MSSRLDQGTAPTGTTCRRVWWCTTKYSSRFTSQTLRAKRGHDDSCARLFWSATGMNTCRTRDLQCNSMQFIYRTCSPFENQRWNCVWCSKEFVIKLCPPSWPVMSSLIFAIFRMQFLLAPRLKQHELLYFICETKMKKKLQHATNWWVSEGSQKKSSHVSTILDTYDSRPPSSLASSAPRASCVPLVACCTMLHHVAPCCTSMSSTLSLLGPSGGLHKCRGTPTYHPF